MTDGTMRERALRFNLESLEIECPHSPLPGFSPEPCADCTVGNLLDFAAAEVSRAVQECIEAVCGYCAHGSPVEKTACVGRAGDSFYHWEEDEFCQAEKLRELLYQKQLATEEEAR